MPRWATPAQSPSSHGKGRGRGHGKGNPNGNGNGNGNDGGHNPPGNNGSVKIHAVAGDTSHHNVPHVTCSFFVDFWGFDQGQVLDVSFTGQAPTGHGTPLTFTAPDGTSITSPDPAGGGSTGGGGATGGSSGSSSGTTVLGLHQSRNTPLHTAPADQSLPFTGAPISTLLVIALGALTGGAMLTVAGRRRRQADDGWDYMTEAGGSGERR